MKFHVLLLALSSPLHAAISFTLPGNSESAAWTGLNATNYTSASGYPSYPTATNPWPAAIDPDSGSTANGSFNKVSGGGYFASSSLYDAGTPGTFSISGTTSLNPETIIFQADLGSAFGSDPVLSFNGGAQSIAASHTGTSTGNFSGGFGGPPVPSTNYAWQWDLSSAPENISSYTIEWTTAPHGTIYQLDLAVADSFTQVVPEPAAPLLALLSFSLLSFKRRRESSNY
ncbi:hypothetical protein ACFSSA_00600 [Luteolibacter algae]|uniref:PEP-CTERM sorting domain-containing protein n=1 Tax=Luteolibacter algae TaxID=454151 RepID=A0ABW5D6A6_9BACT